MGGVSTDYVQMRSVGARFGVTLLNLLLPGLGLFRIGKWRAGLIALLCQVGIGVAILIWIRFAPIASHAQAVIALVIWSAVVALVVLVPMILTWRGARSRKPLAPWSRWYSLIGIFVAWQAFAVLGVDAAHAIYKPFHLPGASMYPTIGKRDRIVGDMRWRGPFRRGQIVLFRNGDDVWVKRVIGLPGDRIAMRGGKLIINGVAVSDDLVRKERSPDNVRGELATIYRERLPGEVSLHEVADAALTPTDDTAETVVPSGHLFVVGDNRDYSADSRVAPWAGGTGPIAMSMVIGRPMFISWGVDPKRTGRALDR